MRQEAPSGAHRDRETRPTRARLPPPLLPIIDAQVRISRGGSSGTPFVFRACAADDAQGRLERASPRQRPCPRKRGRVLRGGRSQRAPPPRASGPRRSHLRLLWSSCLLPLKPVTSTGARTESHATPRR